MARKHRRPRSSTSAASGHHCGRSGWLRRSTRPGRSRPRARLRHRTFTALGPRAGDRSSTCRHRVGVRATTPGPDLGRSGRSEHCVSSRARKGGDASHWARRRRIVPRCAIALQTVRDSSPELVRRCPDERSVNAALIGRRPQRHRTLDVPALDPGRARGPVVSDVAACEEIPTRLDPGCAIRPIPRSSGVPSLETWSSHRRPHGVEAREKEESDGHGIVPHIVRVG